MTDEPALNALPEPHPAAAPGRARIDGPPPRRRMDALPLLYLLGFFVLAGALFYLYRHPAAAPGAEQEAGRVDTMQQQMQALADRMGQLENRPAPTPAANLAPLQARIAELERRPASAGSPADLTPLTARLAELERRPAAPPVDLAPLTARLTELERRPMPPPVDLGPLFSRLDALDGRVRSATDTVTSRLDGIETRLTAVEGQAKQTAGALDGVAQKAQRAARLQVAGAALQAGQKLGDIPGAPPALARFAAEAPPTEAALRLSFNQAAEAAQRASQPAIMDDKPFATRMWNRAQQVVTVRQGDRVLLGDPIAGVLAHAREAVEAGDLPGAVAALNGLAGPAAAAMAGWIAQARALLDARSALAGMAAS